MYSWADTPLSSRMRDTPPPHTHKLTHIHTHTRTLSLSRAHTLVRALSLPHKHQGSWADARLVPFCHTSGKASAAEAAAEEGVGDGEERQNLFFKIDGASSRCVRDVWRGAGVCVYHEHTHACTHTHTHTHTISLSHTRTNTPGVVHVYGCIMNIHTHAYTWVSACVRAHTRTPHFQY